VKGFEMTEAMIWNPIERTLWGITMCLFIVASIMYYYRGRQNDNRKEKMIMYSFAVVYFVYAPYRLFFYLADLQIEGSFYNNAFYGDYATANDVFNFFILGGNFFINLGGIFFIFTCERYYFRQTRYIFTITGIIGTIIMMVAPIQVAIFLANYIINISFFSVTTIFIFYFAKWSRIEFKSITLLIFISNILIFWGFFFGVYITKQFSVAPLEVGPILFIVGTILAILPLVVDPKILSRSIKFWLSIYIPFMIFGIIILFYGVLIGYQITILPLGIIVITVISYLFFQIIGDIKSGSLVDHAGGDVDVLEMFSRPQKITEEEVSISKEKKVCLVCKGTGLRFTYICPECNAIYCQKCARTLTDIENSCWVCETPFDKSKPVKLLKKDEEQLIIEEEVELKGRGNVK
jgi:hypothetical protein